jgi:hypothetical protein
MEAAMKIRIAALISALLMLLPCLSVLADNSTRIPGYTIHHNALNSDFLTPEIADSYGIQRSKYRGLLNVSVIREKPGTTGQAVSARIKVKAANLMDIPKNIELREVREGEAIYYLGDFPITDREIVNFRLEVTPEGMTNPVEANLTQQFYID